MIYYDVLGRVTKKAACHCKMYVHMCTHSNTLVCICECKHNTSFGVDQHVQYKIPMFVASLSMPCVPRRHPKVGPVLEAKEERLFQ